MKATLRWGAAALALSFLAAAADAAPRARSHWVCVTNERSGDLTIVDGSARRVVATVPLGKRARGIHASPDGRFLYVALSGGAIAAPAERRAPTTLAGFPDGRAVEGADGIGVIDVSRRALTRVLPTGVAPEDFALSPDGTRLLVSHPGSSTVTLVRLEDGRIERSVRVDQGPEGVGVTPTAAPSSWLARWRAPCSRSTAEPARVSARSRSGDGRAPSPSSPTGRVRSWPPRATGGCT